MSPKHDHDIYVSDRRKMVIVIRVANHGIQRTTACSSAKQCYFKTSCALQTFTWQTIGRFSIYVVQFCFLTNNKLTDWKLLSLDICFSSYRVRIVRLTRDTNWSRPCPILWVGIILLLATATILLLFPLLFLLFDRPGNTPGSICYLRQYCIHEMTKRNDRSKSTEVWFTQHSQYKERREWICFIRLKATGVW